MPTFQAVGSPQDGTGSLTPTWPTHAADDIALLVVSQGWFLSDPGAATLTTASGFVSVGSGVGDLFGGEFYRHTVFWRRATNASQAAPVVAASANGGIAQIFTFRGCRISGNPWDVISTPSGYTGGGGGTAVTLAGATTTVPNTLVVATLTAGNGSSTSVGDWTNAALASITEQGDAFVSPLLLALTTGDKATAGAIGDTTATLTVACPWAGMVIALRGENIPSGNLLLLGCG